MNIIKGIEKRKKMGRLKGSKNKKRKETGFEKFIREKEEKQVKEEKEYCPGNNLEEIDVFEQEKTI